MFRAAATIILSSALFVAVVAGAQSRPAIGHEPSRDGATVIAQQRALLAAFQRQDAVAFNRILGSDIVYSDQDGTTRLSRDDITGMLKSCVTRTATMEKPTTEERTGLVVLTYESSRDQVCSGKRSPAKARVVAVWQRREGRWVAVSIAEIPASAK